MPSNKNLPKELLEEEKKLKKDIKKEDDIFTRMKREFERLDKGHQKVLKAASILAKAGLKFTYLGQFLDVVMTFRAFSKAKKDVYRKYTFPDYIYDPETEKELRIAKENVKKRLLELEHHKKIVTQAKDMLSEKNNSNDASELITNAELISKLSTEEMQKLMKQSSQVIAELKHDFRENESVWSNSRIDKLAKLEGIMGFELERDKKLIVELDRIISNFKRIEAAEFYNLQEFMKSSERFKELKQQYMKEEEQEAKIEETLKQEIVQLEKFKAIVEEHQKNTKFALSEIFSHAKDIKKDIHFLYTDKIHKLIDFYALQEQKMIANLEMQSRNANNIIRMPQQRNMKAA